MLVSSAVQQAYVEDARYLVDEALASLLIILLFVFSSNCLLSLSIEPSLIWIGETSTQRQPNRRPSIDLCPNIPPLFSPTPARRGRSRRPCPCVRMMYSALTDQLTHPTKSIRYKAVVFVAMQCPSGVAGPNILIPIGDSSRTQELEKQCRQEQARIRAR